MHVYRTLGRIRASKPELFLYGRKDVFHEGLAKEPGVVELSGVAGLGGGPGSPAKDSSGLNSRWTWNVAVNPGLSTAIRPRTLAPGYHLEPSQPRLQVVILLIVQFSGAGCAMTACCP